MFLSALRVWVAVLSVAALLNAVQCYVDEGYPQQRIYSMQPKQATPLASRLFGVWTLLAAVVRIAFVVSPRHTTIYLAALLSFVLAFLHFISEVFLYHTAPLCAGTLIPIFASGVTIAWMLAVKGSGGKPKSS